MTESSIPPPPPPPPPSEGGGHRNAKADAKAAKAYAKAQRPWYKKKRFIIPIAFVILMVIVAGTSGGGDDLSRTVDNGMSDSNDSAMDEPAAEEESEPDMTSGQKNAVRSAKNYLSVSGFSRKGLIQQLSSDAGDGYSVEDATFAVDYLDVDWKEQAVRSAKNYLDVSGFSRDGLIQQLSSDAGDGYTVEEATYGADKALAEQE